MARFVHAYIGMNLALAISVLSLLCLGCEDDSAKRVNHISPVRQAHETADSVFLVIDYAADRADTMGMVLFPSDTLTVLGLLQDMTARENIVLETREYPIGMLVERIGDRKNGEGGYWLYVVNGESIPVAASAYQVKFGDTVRFFFRE